MKSENQYSTVGKILYAQVLVTLDAASVFLLTGSPEEVLSSIIGSSIGLVSNSYFAYKLYLARFMDARRIVNAFYTGEAIKIAITAAMFLIAVQISFVNFPALFAGYIAVLSVHWFALYFWRD